MYDCFSHSRLLFSSHLQVKVDGMWKEMPGDFPKLVTRGNKQMFQFSLPKFNGSVHYDPVIEMGDDSSVTSSTTSKPSTTKKPSTTPSKPSTMKKLYTTPSKAWKTQTHFSMLFISLVVLLAKFVVLEQF